LSQAEAAAVQRVQVMLVVAVVAAVQAECLQEISH
jgi:hypothetical protein